MRWHYIFIACLFCWFYWSGCVVKVVYFLVVCLWLLLLALCLLFSWWFVVFRRLRWLLTFIVVILAGLGLVAWFALVGVGWFCVVWCYVYCFPQVGCGV